MNVEQFTRRRQDDWSRLAELIRAAGTRPQRLGADQVLELGNLYRAAVGDLAQLTAHAPGDAVTTKIGELVVSARQLVYGDSRRTSRLTDVLFREYWQRIAERPGMVLVALAALLIPAALGWLWVTVAPDAATGIIPGQFLPALNPGPAGTDQGMTGAEQVLFSAELFANNTRVAIAAFAFGMLLCVGAILLLAQNGVILGVIGGYLVSSGNGAFFVELAAAHGILELSCIVVAGAAGIRLGWAIVDPGRMSRIDALREEARATVVIVVGTAAWLAVAAIIESFVSRRGLEALPVTVIGVIIGTMFWGLVWRASRRRVTDQSRASDLALR